jgi:predicted component of type VI protein secretion system
MLRVFCEALLDLRRGVEEAGRSLGVRSVEGRSPLHLAREPGEMLRHLLDPSVPRERRRTEVLELFSAFAAHQVATIAGVEEGARALLARLDPVELGIEKGPKFMPILDRERWQLYVEAFGNLQTSDQELHERLFGAEFAEAYAAALAGGRSRRR